MQPMHQRDVAVCPGSIGTVNPIYTNVEQENTYKNMMRIDSFEDGLKLAQEFLQTKERENYYGFKSYDEESDKEYIVLNKLDEDEFSAFLALREKYGKGFEMHLDEICDDPDYIHDFTGGAEICEIDLDKVWHMYGFTLHELQSDGTLRHNHSKIDLKDDEYARLIAWHLYDKDLTINRLRYHDRNLYETIMNGADRKYSYDLDFFEATEPFLVTLDEAKADAELLVKQHGIEYYVGTLQVPMF